MMPVRNENQMENEKLKPCPCCGEKAELRETEAGFGVWCYGEECGIGTTENNWTKDGAIGIWNKRTEVPQITNIENNYAPITIDNRD